MRKFLFRCLLLSLLFQLQAVKAIYAQCTFTNPIQQAESPDPYVLYNNGFYYYMVTTGDGVWIHKSANLQDVGHASRTKVWGSGGEIRRDVWAPELHYLNGRWYIYACGNLSDDGFNMRMFVLEGNSQDPMGSYTYRGLLAPEASGIDGSAWQDPANGKIYYTWSQFDPQGQTIWIAPMDSPTVVGHPRVRISEPTNGWERIDGLVNEGPIFLKKNNKLHIIYSASQCASAAYCLGRLTCSDGNYLNAGSWGKVGPVFQRSDANGVYGAGHNGFTKSPNGQEDWIVYHAKSGTAFTNSDRSVRIQRFGWNSDDTPNFGIPERTGVQLACPSAGIVPQTPYTGVINLPGVVEAENFDNGSEGVSYHDMTPSNLIGPFRSGTDVDTEPCTEGGNNLAFSDNGEWLEYTVNVANTRAYTLDARVASPFNTGAFHIEMDGANITGTLAVPNTGGWQTWATVSKIVNLTAGQHIMRFVIDAKEFNTNKFTFTAQGNPPVQTQTPYAEVIGLPGVVEAENFDNGGESIAYHDTEEANLGGVQRTTGPDVFTCVSAEGSNAVGWINNGEWLEYTVNAATAGSYTINARVASVFATGIFHLEWDGKNVSGAIAVPNTGDWQAWQSVTKKVTLTAGQHILRVFADAGNFNLNKITFSQGTTPPPMSGVYRLVNRQSKLVLDVSGCSQDNGMKVQQWTWLGSNCQRWKITATDNGYYKLTAQHSGQALEIGAALTANGAKANQWPSNDCTCQQWKIEPTDGGYYKLTARHSTQVLEVGNALMNDGAQVNQFPWNTAACQQWSIEPVAAFARQGVEEVTAAASLHLSPNPASNQVNVTWEGMAANGAVLTIVNTLGKQVEHQQIGKGVSSHLLNTSQFNNGLYIITLHSGQDVVKAKLIISQ